MSRDAAVREGQLWNEFVSKLSISELVDLLGEIPTSEELQGSQLRLAGKALRRHEAKLARELCMEVLDSAKNDNSLLQAYVEACNLLAIAALEEKDLKSAKHHCDLSSRMAQRAELTEDFWAAQFNAAGIYLQLGEVVEAQRRLRALWPLLDSNDVPNEMKAAFLSLASEQGDPLQAVELQRKVLSYAGAEPFNQAVCPFHLARKLQVVGRVEEACEALEAAARIGKECDAPGEFLCEVIARWCESETKPKNFGSKRARRSVIG